MSMSLCRCVRLILANQYKAERVDGGCAASARAKVLDAGRPTSTPADRNRSANATANAARSTPLSNVTRLRAGVKGLPLSDDDIDDHADDDDAGENREKSFRYRPTGELREINGLWGS